MPTVNRIRTVATGVAGSPWYVNMHFAGEGGPSAADEVAAVVAFWQQVAGFLDNAVTYQVQSDVVQLDSATGQQTGIVVTPGGARQGTDASPALPPANQGLIRLTSNAFFGGRRIRGRIFVPGVTSGSQDANGKPSADFRLAMQQGATYLVQNGLSIYSPTNRVVAVVSGVSTWTEFAVLRSRRD